MKNYIYTNSSILIDKLELIISKSKIKKYTNSCPICDEEFYNIYSYVSGKQKIKFDECVGHMLKKHNMIEPLVYKSICQIKIKSQPQPNDIIWCLLNTNGLNIIDGLYEIGSNQIYSEKNKTIGESKITRFSEHSGFIYFENEKINNVVVLNNFRVEPSDPLIYMPTNSLEALKVDYIYHTHPKTPYIGSRIKNGIIYEFPSISDILHYIEHHNNGKLLGSIVIAPEGTYIIRKYNFDRKKFKIDYDLMIDNLEIIFMECYNDSYYKYSNLDYKSLTVDGEIKIPDNIFYREIATNYEYIEKINLVLKRYDLFIDYYARILFDKNINVKDKWIFPDIYVPLIN